MFNIGAGELLGIFLIALVFWGPNALPEIGKSLGRLARNVRQFARQMRDELGPAAGELDELRSSINEIRNPVAAIAREVSNAPSRLDEFLMRKTEGARGSESQKVAPKRDSSPRQSSLPLATEDDYLSMMVESDYAHANDNQNLNHVDAPGDEPSNSDANAGDSERGGAQ